MPKNDFKLHDTVTAPSASAEILGAVEKGWGFVPNLHRVLAESPVALEAYQALWAAAERTSLSAIERNIVYLAIIFENQCRYCMAGHSNLSRMAKVDEQAILAIRAGQPIADPKLEALRHFAALVTRNRGMISDSEIQLLKAAGYTNETILDVLVLGATKLISNYANHMAETPLDPFMKGAEWEPPHRVAASAAALQ